MNILSNCVRIALFCFLYFSCPPGEPRSLFCLQLCSACPLKSVLPCQHIPSAQSLWCLSHSHTSICLNLSPLPPSLSLSSCCLSSPLTQPPLWRQLSFCLAVVRFWPLLCQSVANYLLSLQAPGCLFSMSTPSVPLALFLSSSLIYFSCSVFSHHLLSCTAASFFFSCSVLHSFLSSSLHTSSFFSLPHRTPKVFAQKNTIDRGLM